MYLGRITSEEGTFFIDKTNQLTSRQLHLNPTYYYDQDTYYDLQKCTNLGFYQFSSFTDSIENGKFEQNNRSFFVNLKTFTLRIFFQNP